MPNGFVLAFGDELKLSWHTVAFNFAWYRKGGLELDSLEFSISLSILVSFPSPFGHWESERREIYFSSTFYFLMPSDDGGLQFNFNTFQAVESWSVEKYFFLPRSIFNYLGWWWIRLIRLRGVEGRCVDKTSTFSRVWFFEALDGYGLQDGDMVQYKRFEM